jgi:hypothetical protein
VTPVGAASCASCTTRSAPMPSSSTWLPRPGR